MPTRFLMEPIFYLAEDLIPIWRMDNTNDSAADMDPSAPISYIFPIYFPFHFLFHFLLSPPKEFPFPISKLRNKGFI